jgi:hypothetical protein
LNHDHGRALEELKALQQVLWREHSGAAAADGRWSCHGGGR